jgi:hypothetical protein
MVPTGDERKGKKPADEQCALKVAGPDPPRGAWLEHEKTSFRR